MTTAKNDKTSADKPEETTANNLAMWDRLMPTDPKYTKAFKGAGGFSGTAINGTYILQRLTEEFGPCGLGWRFVLDHEEVLEGHKLKSGDAAKLHKVRGHLEYRSDTIADGIGVWIATSPQFGQTMLVGENKYGTFTDEEAPKKSITDCISKCSVLLGIAADVHLGLFDDNKYVNQRKAEVAEENGTAPSVGPTGDERAPQNEPEPPKRASADDMAWARTVFDTVKSLIEKAGDNLDIDNALKANATGLNDLKRISEPNYESLKKLVVARREAIKKDPIAPGFDDSPAILSEER